MLAQFLHDLMFSSTTSAFPEPDTMAELIVILSNISREWDQHKPVLVYHGIQGAAWVMVYSWVVLRLPIWIVGLDGKAHTVHSSAASTPFLTSLFSFAWLSLE